MSEKASNIQTALMGISTLILTAGVPWAYVMQGRVSSIETTSQINAELTKGMAGDIKAQTINASRIDELSRRLDRLEAK